MKKSIVLAVALCAVGSMDAMKYVKKVGSAVKGGAQAVVDTGKQATYSSARLSRVVNNSDSPALVCIETRQRESIPTTLSGAKTFHVVFPGQTLTLDENWGEIPWIDINNPAKAIWIATGEGILKLWDNFGANRNEGRVERAIYSSLPEAKQAAIQEQNSFASGGDVVYRFASPGEVFGVEVLANPAGRLRKIK